MARFLAIVSGFCLCAWLAGCAHNRQRQNSPSALLPPAIPPPATGSLASKAFSLEATLLESPEAANHRTLHIVLRNISEDMQEISLRRPQGYTGAVRLQDVLGLSRDFLETNYYMGMLTSTFALTVRQLPPGAELRYEIPLKDVIDPHAWTYIRPRPGQSVVGFSALRFRTLEEEFSRSCAITCWMEIYRRRRDSPGFESIGRVESNRIEAPSAFAPSP